MSDVKMNRHQRRAAKHRLPYIVINTPEFASRVELSHLHGVHRGRKFAPRLPTTHGQSITSAIASARTEGGDK